MVWGGEESGDREEAKAVIHGRQSDAQSEKGPGSQPSWDRTNQSDSGYIFIKHFLLVLDLKGEKKSKMTSSCELEQSNRMAEQVQDWRMLLGKGECCVEV